MRLCISTCFFSLRMTFFPVPMEFEAPFQMMFETPSERNIDSTPSEYLLVNAPMWVVSLEGKETPLTLTVISFAPNQTFIYLAWSVIKPLEEASFFWMFFLNMESF